MRHTALGHEVENSEPITRNLDICAVSATLPSQFLSNVNGNTFQRTLTWSKLYGYLGNLSSIIQRLDRAARSPALRDEGILLTTARAPGRAEDDIKDYVHAQSCRRIFLNGFFGNDYNDIENCCDNCDPDTQESSPPLETTLDMKMVDVEPSKQSTDIEPGEQYLKKRDTIMSDDRIKKLASKSVGIMTPESIFVATGWLFPRTEYALALCKIIVDLNADTVLKRQATSGRLSPEEQNSQALQRQMTYLRQTRHFNYITSKDVQPLQHFLKSQVDYKALPQRSEPHRRLVQDDVASNSQDQTKKTCSWKLSTILNSEYSRMMRLSRFNNTRYRIFTKGAGGLLGFKRTGGPTIIVTWSRLSCVYLALNARRSQANDLGDLGGVAAVRTKGFTSMPVESLLVWVHRVMLVERKYFSQRTPCKTCRPGIGMLNMKLGGQKLKSQTKPATGLISSEHLPQTASNMSFINFASLRPSVMIFVPDGPMSTSPVSILYSSKCVALEAMVPSVLFPRYWLFEEVRSRFLRTVEAFEISFITECSGPLKSFTAPLGLSNESALPMNGRICDGATRNLSSSSFFQRGNVIVMVPPKSVPDNSSQNGPLNCLEFFINLSSISMSALGFKEPFDEQGKQLRSNGCGALEFDVVSSISVDDANSSEAGHWLIVGLGVGILQEIRAFKCAALTEDDLERSTRVDGSMTALRSNRMMRRKEISKRNILLE
ncbi:hypothetical protein BX616_001273 [Lobosporangium transversale]|nr:hypothetical protein BX616_001273 [Lobosporangium transversale]